MAGLLWGIGAAGEAARERQHRTVNPTKASPEPPPGQEQPQNRESPAQLAALDGRDAPHPAPSTPGGSSILCPALSQPQFQTHGSRGWDQLWHSILRERWGWAELCPQPPFGVFCTPRRKKIPISSRILWMMRVGEG